jgi:hypothetical protein
MNIDGIAYLAAVQSAWIEKRLPPSPTTLQQAGMPSAQLRNCKEKSSTARQRERNHATIRKVAGFSQPTHVLTTRVHGTHTQ